MLIEGEMDACIGRGGEEVPTARGDLKISVDILGGFQTKIEAGTCFQSDEIQWAATNAKNAQIVAQHQGYFGIMQT